MYTENKYTINFSDFLEKDKKLETLPNVLINTKTYYESECKQAIFEKTNIIEKFKEITCFTLDNVLSKKECDNLIQLTEEKGYKDLLTYRKGYRDNQRIVIEDEISAEILFKRVKKFLPYRISVHPNMEWTLHSINPNLRFGKYNKNDAFKAHKDSGYNPSYDIKPMLTIMFYLSPTLENKGRTRMLTLNKTNCQSEDINCKILDMVIPVPGRCVIFNQYTIYHDGETVGECETPKYIMRTDIMYKLSK